jgi:hypothetical protein
VGFVRPFQELYDNFATVAVLMLVAMSVVLNYLALQPSTPQSTIDGLAVSSFAGFVAIIVSTAVYKFWLWWVRRRGKNNGQVYGSEKQVTSAVMQIRDVRTRGSNEIYRIDVCE